MVAAKGLASVGALALAFVASADADRRNVVRTGPIFFLGGIVVCSTLGAMYTGSTLLASSVLSLRLLVLALAIYCARRAYSAIDVIKALALAMATFAVVGVATGVGTAASGRLEGAIPPLNPNEVTELCSLVLLVVLWIALVEPVGWLVTAIPVLLAVVWLTGSRTGLLALMLAIAVQLIIARRQPKWLIIGTLSVVPFLVYLFYGTNVLGQFLGRGGSENVTTLNARTVAWSAAFHLHKEFWDQWFGNGLSMVRIPVVAQFRSTQILDSSWVSALVQGGIVGLALLAVWVVRVAAASVSAQPPLRPIAVSILIFIVVRSVLESGLIDATPAFLFLVLLGTNQWAPSPQDRSVGLHRLGPTTIVDDLGTRAEPFARTRAEGVDKLSVG